MKIERIWKVYFSPAGSTRSIMNRLADKIGKALELTVHTHDYTLPTHREQKIEFEKTDLVLWGTPVYAGRIPNKTLPYVQHFFEGHGAMAVPVVVFGNRSFDNSLIELKNELENNQFHVVAAGAVVSRHSFSKILAAGRPDSEDWEKLDQFADDIVNKVVGLTDWGMEVNVPGDNPPNQYYTPKGLAGETTVFLKAVPQTDLNKCDGCSVCIKICPMSAIEKNDPSKVTGTCIKCQACVLRCPQHAKYFEDKAFLSHVAMLERDFTRRAESAFFL